MKKVLLTLALCALCASQVMAQSMCPKAREAAQKGGISVEEAVAKFCR